MDESLQLASDTTTESWLELGSVSDVSLNDWNEELSAGSNKTRAEKHGGSLSTNAEPIPGTKDPTKSLKCDAKLQKKGEKAPSTGPDALKKAVVAKTVTKPSHPLKEKSVPKERRSGSQQSATLGQSSTTDMAALLKEAFSGLAVEMNKGFSSLGALCKSKHDAKCDDNVSAVSDSESDDHGDGSDKEPEEPARKKQKKLMMSLFWVKTVVAYLINLKISLMSRNKMALKLMET